MTRASMLTVLVAASCSGSTNPVLTQPDAPGDDAPGPTPGPHVWISGDWLTNNIDNAGAFAPDATLPVVPGTVLPGTGQRLASRDFVVTRAGVRSNVLDLDQTGSHMAYITIDDAQGTQAVYMANGDGSSPILLYTAPANVSLGSVSISPDGHVVAFSAADYTVGMLDLYVTAPGTGAFKVTPDRPANDDLDVDPHLAWSPTSRYLAFYGSFTEVFYNELYIVDVLQGFDPPHVTRVLGRSDIHVPEGNALIAGVINQPAFDRDDNLWLAARIENSSTPHAELLLTNAVVPSTPTAVPLPSGPGLSAEVGELAIAPDGQHIAFAADAIVPTAFEVFYAPTATPALATRLTDGTVPAQSSPTALAFSPDGTRLAFSQDLTGEVVLQPYVVSVAGGSPVRLVALSLPHNAYQLAWSGTDTLYCLGNLVENEWLSLFRLDPGAHDQTPQLAVVNAAGGSITDLDVR